MKAAIPGARSLAICKGSILANANINTHIGTNLLLGHSEQGEDVLAVKLLHRGLLQFGSRNLEREILEFALRNASFSAKTATSKNRRFLAQEGIRSVNDLNSNTISLLVRNAESRTNL